MVLLHDRQGRQGGGKTDEKELEHGKDAGTGDADQFEDWTKEAGNEGENPARFDHLHQRHHDDEDRQKDVEGKIESLFPRSEDDFDEFFHVMPLKTTTPQPPP
jgi:hypothetical protein